MIIDTTSQAQIEVQNDTILTTSRLILRQWRLTDLDAFTTISQDPQVMKYFVNTLSREDAKAFIIRNMKLFDSSEYCLYVVEHKTTHEFMGFVGLWPFEIPNQPAAIEIGWRLAARFWHQGFAAEAATGVIRYAASTLKIKDLVSTTSMLNLPSQAVMHRLGFTCNPTEDFEHPNIPAGHPLRSHLLYRRNIAHLDK